jgi:thiosulfate reductase cytochrome b subunit
MAGSGRSRIVRADHNIYLQSRPNQVHNEEGEQSLKSHFYKGHYLATAIDRLWHWIHALGILLLILSGFNIHFARYFNPLGTFENAVAIHNFVGLIVVFDWGLWILYNLFSRRISFYLPNGDDFLSGIFKQAKYYLSGIFLNNRAPFPIRPSRKFNPLQKWTYLVIMAVLAPFEIVTGLYMLYMIEGWGNFIGSQVRIISILHTIGAFMAAIFLAAHIYLATTGKKPYSHFIMMITGYHEPE